MTTPTLPADGKTVVLQPGASPVMLTEYAFPGCLVINTAAAGLVWLGTGSGVGPSGGVPLEPSTSAKWTQNGQLWAMLDPAATASVTIVLTDRVDGWEQDPTVIAEITAQQLLASGIPPVLVQANLTHSTNPNQPWDVLAAGAGGLTYDVSKYTSVIVQIVVGANSGTYGYSVLASQDGMLGVVLSTMGMPSLIGGAHAFVPFTLPTTGKTLTLSSPAGASVVVLGSNRATARLTGGQPDLPRDFSIPSTAMTNGVLVHLPPADGGREAPQGPYLATVSVVTDNVSGYFGYYYCKPDGTIGQVYPLGSGTAVATPTATRQTYQSVPLPAAGIWWFFRPTLTGTGTAEVTVSPA